AHSRRHLQTLQHLTRARIDTSQLAFIAFPCAVPQFSVDPGYAGDKAVRLDGAQDRTRVWIHLMDLTLPIFPHPQRSFCPGESRVATPARRWNRGDHAIRVRIDFLDAVLGDLEQVLTVE